MELDVNDYTYNLPEERIALYPLPQRDQSKLLVYNHGTIQHEKFADLSKFLPHESTLFFNETKVIPARLYFKKASGASIEIFLLHPLKPSGLLLNAMQAKHHCSWKCTIGNLKRWTSGTTLLLKLEGIKMDAFLEDRNEGIVRFSWSGDYTFAEVLQRTGNTPLPPYLKRNAEETDKDRYQTVYSSKEGAVAAPTAGLHFTSSVFKSLQDKRILTDFLTLHVSAGTFQPIKVKNAWEHKMHQEQVVVSRQNIENILRSKNVVAVGTTSIRTLESLYWYGVKLLKNPEAAFIISQQDPYMHLDLPSAKSSLQALMKYMDNHQIENITGETSIYIVPGYTFKVCNALITNFHQPASTLILLVAAFIGKDWKKVYAEALNRDYRFLSYGDSSLLIPEGPQSAAVQQ